MSFGEYLSCKKMLHTNNSCLNNECVAERQTGDLCVRKGSTLNSTVMGDVIELFDVGCHL